MSEDKKDTAAKQISKQVVDKPSLSMKRPSKESDGVKVKNISKGVVQVSGNRLKPGESGEATMSEYCSLHKSLELVK